MVFANDKSGETAASYFCEVWVSRFSSVPNNYDFNTIYGLKKMNNLKKKTSSRISAHLFYIKKLYNLAGQASFSL